MRSSSVWPGASILPFWSASTARKASGPSPPGRQNRPDPLPKKNRTFPLGNALLYIQTANDFFQTRRTLRGASLSFCHSGNPSPSAQPSLLVRLRAGNCSVIQLTKENEKSEPFSCWKRFGFFACTTTTAATTVVAVFCFVPQYNAWDDPGRFSLPHQKTNPKPQKTSSSQVCINISNLKIVFIYFAQNKKRFVLLKKMFISRLTGCFRPQKR